MSSLRKCSFCGRDVSLGEGIVYVRNDGSSQTFCSSKCRKNSVKLGRDPRKFKWTKVHGRVEKQK